MSELFTVSTYTPWDNLKTKEENCLEKVNLFYDIVDFPGTGPVQRLAAG